VLAARADRLPNPTKRVLQTASVLGREFSPRLLKAICTDSGDVMRHLSELARLEFIHELPGPREQWYAFKHVLTQEVAYESLSIARRQSLHETTGKTLESLYPDRLDEYDEMLAHHFSRSPNTEKALEYLDRANANADKANAAHEAIALFDRVMALLDGLPETRLTLERRLSLIVRQGVVFESVWRMPDWYQLLLRFEDAAVRLGEPGLLGAFYGRLGWLEWYFGDTDRSIEAAARGATLCEAAGNYDDAGQAFIAWQVSLFNRAEYAQSLCRKDDVLRVMARSFNVHWHTRALHVAALTHCRLGEWKEAIAAGDEELRTAGEAADDLEAATAAILLALVYGDQGDLPRAFQYGELAVQKSPLPDKSGVRRGLALVWCRSGAPRRRGVETGTTACGGPPRFKRLPDLPSGQRPWPDGRTGVSAARLRQHLVDASRHGHALSASRQRRSS